MSVPDELPQGSIEFLEIDFDSAEDLTVGTVQIGLSQTVGDPPAAWMPATWPTPGENSARTTSPVDTSTLPVGHYRVWAKLTDSPEILERPYGMVRIV